MNFNGGDRKRLLLTATFNVDPADFTLTLLIDQSEQPCEWLGAATKAGDKWTRQARTLARFYGPQATSQPGDVALTKGLHLTRMRSSNGDTTVTAPTDPIYVP